MPMQGIRKTIQTLLPGAVAPIAIMAISVTSFVGDCLEMETVGVASTFRDLSSLDFGRGFCFALNEFTEGNPRWQEQFLTSAISRHFLRRKGRSQTDGW